MGNRIGFADCVASMLTTVIFKVSDIIAAYFLDGFVSKILTAGYGGGKDLRNDGFTRNAPKAHGKNSVAQQPRSFGGLMRIKMSFSMKYRVLRHYIISHRVVTI